HSSKKPSDEERPHGPIPRHHTGLFETFLFRRLFELSCAVRRAVGPAQPAVAVMSHFEALSRLTVGDRRSGMIKLLLRRAIDKFERDWNYDASYMRDMIDASPRAAWLFSRVTALGQFRLDLPIQVWCAAGITAVRHEDCGPCTQLGVTMAERAGVSPAVL